MPILQHHQQMMLPPGLTDWKRPVPPTAAQLTVAFFRRLPAQTSLDIAHDTDKQYLRAQYFVCVYTAYRRVDGYQLRCILYLQR
jgi:hypothetical protein